MIILHLSDLHFDRSDPLEQMREKWEKMICCIRDSGIQPDTLVISGDTACYQNREENFDLALGFLDRLIFLLKIDRERIFLCAGNHELELLREEPRCACSTVGEMDKAERRRLDGTYRQFYERICCRAYPEKSWEKLETKDAVLLVVSAYAALDRDRRCWFLPECESVGEEMAACFSQPDRVNIIVQHSSQAYVCYQCDKKIPYGVYPAITLCGHKDFGLQPTFLPLGESGVLIAGVSDGFVEERVTYGIYQVEKTGVAVNVLRYSDGEWQVLTA